MFPTQTSSLQISFQTNCTYVTFDIKQILLHSSCCLGILSCCSIAVKDMPCRSTITLFPSSSASSHLVLCGTTRHITGRMVQSSQDGIGTVQSQLFCNPA